VKSWYGWLRKFTKDRGTALPHQPHHPDNQRRYQGEKEINYEVSYRLRGSDFLAGFSCARFSGSSIIKQGLKK